MKLKGLIGATAVAALVSALAAPDAKLPDGWLVTGDARGCRTTTEAVPSAPTPRAFVIECPTGTQGFATIMQQFSATELAGKRVRLQAKVRGEGIQQWSGLWLRGDAADRGIKAFDNMEQRPLKASFDWRTAEIVLDIPKDVVQLNFGFLLAGPGKLLATQFDLSEVPTTIPVTAGMSLPAKPKNLTP